MPILEVSIYSLVSNTSSEYQYNIYILYNSEDGPLREDCLNAILEYRQKNIDICFIDIKGNYYNICFRKTIPHFSRAMLYSLFLDKYIYKDKVLYLDSDTIINQDISIFYNEDITNYLFGAILDEGVTFNYIRHFVQDKKYFNAGILLINLKKYREQEIQSKCIKLFNSRRTFLYQEQDVLNAIAEGQVKYLHPRYNMQWAALFFKDRPAEFYLSNEFELTEEDWENPYIIHYNGIHKPWKQDRDHKYAKYWWNYARQTKIYGGI